MIQKSWLLSVAALTLTAAVFVPKAADAYQGNPLVKGPNYTPERHALTTKAFINGDYNLWRSQMTEGQGVTKVINITNFSQFAKAHQLAESGNLTEANKIRTSLGLGQHNGQGQQRSGSNQEGRGMHRGR